MSTPHARRSTRGEAALDDVGDVYPACAGIHRKTVARRLFDQGLPRMRGDPPHTEIPYTTLISSTPHARGSTSNVRHAIMESSVYPACAGIHLSERPWTDKMRGLPRMRGDPPRSFNSVSLKLSSTPHARGSTPVPIPYEAKSFVYPACAGIHLREVGIGDHISGLPRMRGDPPISKLSEYRRITSTPHARGSTASFRTPPPRHPVYPACAGIHL